jgi:hypothetical protein
MVRGLSRGEELLDWSFPVHGPVISGKAFWNLVKEFRQVLGLRILGVTDKSGQGIGYVWK